MGKFILRRLLLLFPILLGLTLLLFLFIRALPGDPAGAILGERATPEALERVREAMGLNKPLIEQYLAYIAGIVRLDLGHSFITNRDVTDDFLQRFPATIELTLAAHDLRASPSASRWACTRPSGTGRGRTLPARSCR